MLAGTKYTEKDVFFTYFKKHFCPQCQTRLILVKKQKIVNSKSPEADQYDFRIGDGWVVGNVKFIWKDFHCPDCNIDITIEEMRRIEKKQRKIKKESQKNEDNSH